MKFTVRIAIADSAASKRGTSQNTKPAVLLHISAWGRNIFVRKYRAGRRTDLECVENPTC